MACLREPQAAATLPRQRPRSRRQDRASVSRWPGYTVQHSLGFTTAKNLGPRAVQLVQTGSAGCCGALIVHRVGAGVIQVRVEMQLVRVSLIEASWTPLKAGP